MDDEQRIALIETRTTQGVDASPKQLIRYQFGNHLGSASLELDEQAKIISYEEYYPYGSTSYQAASKTIKATAKRYRYTGKERDEESGFYYHGARYYAAWLGRWVSCDPEMPQNIPEAPYVYVRDHPLKYTDENGRSAKDIKDIFLSGLEFGLQTLRVMMLGFLGGLIGLVAGGIGGGIIGGVYGGPLWAVGGTFLGALGGALAGVSAGVVYGLMTWDWARKKIWGGIKSAAGTVWSGLKKAGSGIKSAAGTVWSGLKKAGSGIKSAAGTVWSGLKKAGSGIKSAAGTVWSGLRSAAGWIAEKVKSLFRDPVKAPARPSGTSSRQGTLQSKIENKIKETVEGHFVGPLLPGVNPLGGGLDPTGSVSDDNIHKKTKPAPSTEKGPIPVFEPGVGVGYSYTKSLGSRHFQFSLGFSPTSKLVPYYPGGVSQPLSGPSAGYFFGFSLKGEW
jgi:RHS repeat-associated protein